MKMEKFETSSEIPAPGDVGRQLEGLASANTSSGPGAIVAGAAFLVVALPYWGIRIVSHLVWRDLRRIGRLAGVCGTTYLEALRRAR